MKKLLPLLIGLLATSAVFGDELRTAEYGVAKVFDFRILAADGTFVTNAVDSGTDVSLTCDDGAAATATNDFTDEGSHYAISITAAELQCARLVVDVTDTIANGFIIETYGDPSAGIPIELQSGDAFARLGAPAGASVSADIAAIEGQTDDIGAAGAGLTAADDAVMTRLGTPASTDLAADIAFIEAQTDDIGIAGAGLTVLATQASVDAVDNFVDTEMAAVLNAVATTGVLIAAGEATEIQAAAAAALNAETGDNFTAIPEGYISQFACDSGSTTTCADAGLTQADDFWNGVALRSMSGTTAGQARCVVDFANAGDTLTVVPAFPASLGTGTVQLFRSPLCIGVDPTYVP